MSKFIKVAKRLAKSDSTILICGESGTGKELIAQSIHNASGRKDFPFIAINCAALSESLLESELFGYEEGAFTGALKGGKKGIFELADSGTIFLDEIGDAPLSIQTKLLRVLQEKEIMRVSGSKIIPIDVRVIAATNKNLSKIIEQGLFREDLYYRLNVLSLYVPPLRERTDDIEMLLYYFLHKHGATTMPVIDSELMACLCTYSWPGNVRELENIAEYIATIDDSSNDMKKNIQQLLLHGQKNKADSIKKDITNRLFFRNPEIRVELDSILQILYKAKSDQIMIGRYKIHKLLQKRGLYLTIQQIKTRLDMLKKVGLITTYNGRGSILSETGEQYIHSHFNAK